MFFANAHPDITQDRLFEMHQEWAALFQQENPSAFSDWDNDRSPDRVLRIGYVSPDMRSHSVSYFLQPILSSHDPSAVEVFIYDCTPISDQISVHLHALVKHWHRVVGGGADRIAEMIREHKIDILVDLAGHTAENRLDVFARHPAPVQVAYLGYPNTTGLPQIEYRFTDDLADPVGADTYYTEQLLRLDGGFLCFNPPPPSPDIAPLPSGTSGAITFAAFNAVHKINKKVVSLWSSVLRSLPGSTLLLKGGGMADPETARHYWKTSPARGLPKTASSSSSARLDITNISPSTTVATSLWIPSPITALPPPVKHCGWGFPSSRWPVTDTMHGSASILSRLDLPDLIGHSPEEFIAITAKLAADRDRLAHLRSTLRARMSQSRLMD